MKKFDKIVREGKWQCHTQGDIVTVTEKLDGANASISIDDCFDVKVFSRNNELSEENTLRGWFEYAKEVIQDKLISCYKEFSWSGEKVLYGEWLVPHTLQYKEEFLNKFYPFALYDVEKEQYHVFSDVEKIADKLGLVTPQIFYRGEYNELKDLIGFVGKSNMAVDSGEGIVIFNESKPFGDSRTKIVSEQFSETAKVKTHVIKDLTESEKWALEYATEPRIKKIIHKLFDEGMLPSIEFENFGMIASPTSAEVYRDIVEEESDSIPEYFDEKVAKKIVNKKVPPIVRKFIEATYNVVSPDLAY